MMDIHSLKQYIKEILTQDISLLPWKDEKKLPLFIADAYTFFETSLLNTSCLLMIPKDDSEITPNTIQKHWEQVVKKWGSFCVYTSNSISSYNRKRLIQHHIPFIIPNNQMYVPDLGLDLREYFKQQRKPKKLFSRAAQTVIISTLLGEKNEKLIPSELATALGYSSMTMTRAFNELETVNIGNHIQKGKERHWIFENDKRDLWEQTQHLLRSPIKRQEPMKVFQGCEMPKLPLSNVSSLALEKHKIQYLLNSMIQKRFLNFSKSLNS